MDKQLLKNARANLWRAQERFNYFPDVVIVINDLFNFNFNSQGSYYLSNGCDVDWKEPYLKCYLKPNILEKVLTRLSHWNNLEIGCHIEFDRRPNIYLPDVHTLMSFFHI